MDASSTHSTRTLTIPLTGNPNLLLVAGGSDGNLDVETVNKDIVRSQVRVFNIDDMLAADAPLEYGEASLFGWGLRNSVGWAEDPSTGYIVSILFLPQPVLWIRRYRCGTDLVYSGRLKTQLTISIVVMSISITATLARNLTSMAFPMTLPAPSTVPTTDILDASPSTTPPSSRNTQAEQKLANKWPLRRRERRIWDLQMRNA